METPSLDPTIACQLMILRKRQILNYLKGNFGMTLQTLRAAANQQTAELGKRYPFVRVVGNIIIIGYTATKRKIPVSIRQDTGVITEKGSGQSNHWEELTLALRKKSARLNTVINQRFHLHFRQDSM